MKRLSIEVPDELHAALKHEAVVAGVSMSDLVRLRVQPAAPVESVDAGRVWAGILEQIERAESRSTAHGEGAFSEPQDAVEVDDPDPVHTDCAHPKTGRKQLPFGTFCGVCERRIR